MGFLAALAIVWDAKSGSIAVTVACTLVPRLTALSADAARRFVAGVAILFLHVALAVVTVAGRAGGIMATAHSVGSSASKLQGGTGADRGNCDGGKD